MEAGDVLDEAAHDAEPNLPPRRTKLVFLYSDDEEDVMPAGEKTTGRDGAVVAVDVVPLNPPSAEFLAAEDDTDSAADVLLPFAEDTTGEVVAVGAAPRGRVKVADAPRLWDGTNVDGGGASLRRHLHAEEAKRLLQARKRFRDDCNADEAREKGADDTSAAVGDVDTCGPRPILDDDGLVRAIAVGGYRLTVDEQQLQDSEDDGGNKSEPVAGVGVDSDVHCSLGDNVNDGEVEEEEEEEEEEDEEDEELDEALVVAVVEQLVRCCESDELDEALRDAGANFLLKAQSCLQLLRDGEMNSADFGEEMRSDILRLQRAFQKTQRPKDAPIVVDGVVMDM